MRLPTGTRSLFIAPLATLAVVALVHAGCQSEPKPSAETKPAPAPAATAKPAAANPAAAKPAVAAKPAAVAAPPAQPEIVEESVNVYTWAPADRSEAVDASNINLRKVFEDLGPAATEWYQHVLTLSNPFFEGRAPGSHGNDVAADYIEFWMKRAELDPAFPAASTDGVTPVAGDWVSYRQKFSLGGGARRAVTQRAMVAGEELQPGKDFNVLGVSGSGKTGPLPVVFAGYAISEAKEKDYSSFEGTEDFKGKAVLFMRYEPLNDKGRSKWSEQRFSSMSGMVGKIEYLANHGASAIVMFAPPGAVDGKTSLEDFGSSRWGRAGDIPVIQVSAAVAERLLQAGGPTKRSLMEWRVQADEGAFKTIALASDATIEIESEITNGAMPAQNIGGVLRGKGALADEWLVVGAHYDHVGMGYFGSMPGNAGKLHPGADDNASGTSAMLVLASQCAEYYKGPSAPADARSVLFLAFTAEESGLRGSRWFVEHPTIPADKLSLMLNMDMVGRLRSDDLNVGGVGTAEGLMELLRPSFERSKLTIRADPTGRGPSDHASFYSASVPVIFLYTGNHAEYHQPSDKGYTVNPGGAAKIIALAKDMLTTVATRQDQLVFRKTDRERAPDRGYAGVRLGVMPHMGGDDETAAKHPPGVLVDAISADTSADKAGIKKGDVLISWNGEALPDARKMMDKLRQHKPGDVVKLVIWREGKEMPVDVTLLASQQPPPA